jgi:hypothetical protein
VLYGPQHGCLAPAPRASDRDRMLTVSALPYASVTEGGPCDKMGTWVLVDIGFLLHAHLANIELTIGITEIPLRRQHLCDTLWAVAGQGADELLAAIGGTRNWPPGVRDHMEERRVGVLPAESPKTSGREAH